MNISCRAEVAKALNKAESNLFLDFALIIAKHCYSSFSEMLPLSMVMAALLCAGITLIDHFSLNFLLISWCQICWVASFSFAQLYFLKAKYPWQNLAFISLPYVCVPIALCYILGIIGAILSVLWITATSFFIQFAIAKDSSIVDAYCDSMSLVWRYNIRFIIFLLIPILFFLSTKTALLSLLSISLHGWPMFLLYWVLTVFIIPWVLFSFIVYYEYLTLEKSSDA